MGDEEEGGTVLEGDGGSTPLYVMRSGSVSLKYETCKYL